MIRSHSNGVLLDVHIQPGASKTELAGLYGDALKIRIQAPPVDGKANKALIRFLAKYLQIPAARIEVLKGATGRRKSILITSLEPAAVKLALGLP